MKCFPTKHRKTKQSKKAVLIGLNYTGSSSALKGCINDAKRMKKTLVKNYGYKNVNILTDKDLSNEYNILEVLDTLILSKENYLFFQYSGHGTTVVDLNGDEIDGRDEALYSVNGTLIIDDDINKVIQKVRKNTTMIMIIDACHSGTILDLPYQLIDNKITKINDNYVKGDIICISGSRDDQVSIDVTNGTTSYGAMSNALQTVLSKNYRGITWRYLLYLLRNELSSNGYEQQPELCVSRPGLIDELVSI